MSESFYKKRKWKTKRNVVLRLDEYLCQECKRYGRTNKATTVHHIIPLQQDSSLGLNTNNLVSLCSKCHNSMHDRENDNLTDKGKEWVTRRFGEERIV